MMPLAVYVVQFGKELCLICPFDDLCTLSYNETCPLTLGVNFRANSTQCRYCISYAAICNVEQGQDNERVYIQLVAVKHRVRIKMITYVTGWIVLMVILFRACYDVCTVLLIPLMGSDLTPLMLTKKRATAHVYDCKELVMNAQLRSV